MSADAENLLYASNGWFAGKSDKWPSIIGFHPIGKRALYRQHIPDLAGDWLHGGHEGCCGLGLSVCRRSSDRRAWQPPCGWPCCA